MIIERIFYRTREECEAAGHIWIEVGHRKNGSSIKSYCRKRPLIKTKVVTRKRIRASKDPKISIETTITKKPLDEKNLR